MVGELDVAVADRTVSIEFLGERILLSIPDYGTARGLSKGFLPNMGPVGRVLALNENALWARVGRGKEVELFPRPGWLVRWLSPVVRELVEVVNKKV